MGGVYKNLFDKSLQSLDELLMVITANNLRMSDDERFAAIDKIFNDMEDKLSFLRNFNHSTTVLAMQRGKETIDTKLSQQLYGVH
jgi:valyl-tRNA synthetase